MEGLWGREVEDKMREVCVCMCTCVCVSLTLGIIIVTFIFTLGEIGSHWRVSS